MTPSQSDHASVPQQVQQPTVQHSITVPDTATLPVQDGTTGLLLHTQPQPHPHHHHHASTQPVHPQQILQQPVMLSSGQHDVTTLQTFGNLMGMWQ